MEVDTFANLFEDAPQFKIQRAGKVYVVYVLNDLAFRKIVLDRTGEYPSWSKADNGWTVKFGGQAHTCCTVYELKSFDFAVFYHTHGHVLRPVLKPFRIYLRRLGIGYHVDGKRSRFVISNNLPKTLDFLGITSLESPVRPSDVRMTLRAYGQSDLRPVLRERVLEPIDRRREEWLEQNRGKKPRFDQYGIPCGTIEYYIDFFLKYVEESQDMFTAQEFLQVSDDARLAASFKRFMEKAFSVTLYDQH